MKDLCGAQHPDHPKVACGVRELLADHEEHIGYLTGVGTIDWPNPDYRPKVHLPSSDRLNADQMADLAGSQSAAIRAGSEAQARVDAAADPVWKQKARDRVVAVAQVRETFTADDLWGRGMATSCFAARI